MAELRLIDEVALHLYENDDLGRLDSVVPIAIGLGGIAAISAMIETSTMLPAQDTETSTSTASTVSEVPTYPQDGLEGLAVPVSGALAFTLVAIGFYKSVAHRANKAKALSSQAS